MDVNAILNLVSQGRGSVSAFAAFWLATIIFFQGWLWLSIALLIGIAAGVAERRLFNKRSPPPPSSSVFITGTSTGIGFCLTQRLADEGIIVFAGVRKEADGEKLKETSKRPENIIPVLVDVVDDKNLNQQQVDTCAQEVSHLLDRKNLRLLALVNNAGFGVMGPVEGVTLDKFRRQFEVNVEGLVRVTQAFIPLLRKYGTNNGTHCSRIVHISSGSGRITLPATGVYSPSKYAVESISDALRMELRPWNIASVLVEPGRFHTEFQEKAYKPIELRDGMEPEVEAHYRTLMEEHNAHSHTLKRPPVDRCVDVIVDSLFDTKPMARYLAGMDVQFGIPFADSCPEAIVDLINGKKWAALRN